MKKIFLIIVLLALTVTVNAQTGKGSQNLGLGLGYNSVSTDDVGFNNPSVTTNKFKGWFAGPNYSYFIADKLDVGVFLNYSYSKSESAYETDHSYNKTRGYAAFINLRKYFLFNNKIGIRTGPFAGYQTLKFNATTVYLDKARATSYGGGINADFVYYPAKNFGLTAALGGLSYTHNENTGGTQNSSGNSLALSFANNVSLSVYYVFGK